MQTLSQIKELLTQAGLAPRKAFGQNFLVDQNLMARIVEIAGLTGGETVLEVGPGTGSLTEELLARAGKVVAAEIDRGLGEMLAARFADRPNFVLVRGDVLAGKHEISPEVLAAVRPAAHLVSNLPYNIATPLVAQCLLDSWHVLTLTRPSWPPSPVKGEETPSPAADAASSPLKGEGKEVCRFDRLTFTVQKEVADRLCAAADSEPYGQVSVIVALLGKVTLGPIVPAGAFWPKPNVASRIVRIDFDPVAAGRITNVDTLVSLVNLCFAQRRKQLGSTLKRKDSPFAPEALQAAMDHAGIDPTLRAETIEPAKFLEMANCLAVAPCS